MSEHGHTIHQIYDKSYRSFFAHREMVIGMLKGYIPKEFLHEFDIQHIEPVPADFISDTFQRREGDCIWKVRWKESDWCYVLIMLEFQSTPERFMPVRIVIYTGLLWEKLIKAKMLCKGDTLPPVLPIVLYNGKEPWNHPCEIAELLSPAAKRFLGFQPNQKFFLLDEIRIPKENLSENRDNLYTYLLRFEQLKGKEGTVSFLNDLKEVLNRYDNPNLTRLFTKFIMDVVFKHKRQAGLAVPEVSSLEEACTVIAETVEGWRTDSYDIGFSNGRLEGNLEGRLEGRSEERLDIARNLLAMNLSEQQVINATGLSTEDLRKLTVSTDSIQGRDQVEKIDNSVGGQP